jgi:Na+/proline symporter
MAMPIHPTIVIIAYFLLLSLVGWLTRRNRDMDEYLIARDQIPWWVAALSARANGESETGCGDTYFWPKITT